jgi:predicted naringenin-chalcone synthase
MRCNQDVFGKENAPKGAGCTSIAEDVLKAADFIFTMRDQESLVVCVQLPDIKQRKRRPDDARQDTR